MNPTIISVLSALAAAAWSVLTWQSEQQKTRNHKRDQMSAQYVNTLILSTQELQHRLYKILEQDELKHYQHRHASTKAVNPAAVNLLYCLSCFFGWALLTFRFGPYTRDPRMIAIMAQIGEVMESRTRFEGEAFRFTHSERLALGDAVIQRVGETPYGPAFINLTEFKFEEQLASDKAEHLLLRSHQVHCTMRAIEKAIEGEPLEGRDRLAVLQNLLVDLLDYIERQEGFRVHMGERHRVPLAINQIEQIPVSYHPDIEIVHHIPGRLRLNVAAVRQDWECAERVERVLCALDHVACVKVNPRAASILIEYDRDAAEENLIEAIVAAVRYETDPEADGDQSTRIIINTADVRGMSV